MALIELFTEIRAPVERVFDLARSGDLHRDTCAHTGERAVAGVTSGLVGLGDTVTWEARHFGVWQRLTSRVAFFDRPNVFVDSMIRGAFRRFDHHHHFTRIEDDHTLLRDVFDYDAPLGLLGRAAELLFLSEYMRRFLSVRNAGLKAAAESDRWRVYLCQS